MRRPFPQAQGEPGSVTLTIPAERFTEKTRLVLELAREEARAMRHNYVGTEHLLLGLTREGEGIAVGLLRMFGATLEKRLQQNQRRRSLNKENRMGSDGAIIQPIQASNTKRM